MTTCQRLSVDTCFYSSIVVAKYDERCNKDDG